MGWLSLVEFLRKGCFLGETLSKVLPVKVKWVEKFVQNGI